MSETLTVYKNDPAIEDLASAFLEAGGTTIDEHDGSFAFADALWCYGVAGQVSHPATHVPVAIERMLGKGPKYSLELSYERSLRGELLAVQLSTTLAKRWGAAVMASVWHMFSAHDLCRWRCSFIEDPPADGRILLGDNVGVLFQGMPNVEVAFQELTATRVGHDDTLRELVMLEARKKNVWSWALDALDESYFLEHRHAQVIVGAPQSVEMSDSDELGLRLRAAARERFSVDPQFIVRIWVGYSAELADELLGLVIAERLMAPPHSAVAFGLFNEALDVRALSRLQAAGRGLIQVEQFTETLICQDECS